MEVQLRPGPSLRHLAWRQLLRDLRAGELRLLVVAVMLAVAALAAVGFFADRLNHGLARDARQLLGGDAIVLADHPVLTETTGNLLALLVIALITWSLINVVHLVDRFLMARYRVDRDSLQARRITTQVVVLKRLAYVVIAVFAVSMALMQFETIRHVGTSVLASAGLAGIVLGFAAQRTLGNLLAGIQIALRLTTGGCTASLVAR